MGRYFNLLAVRKNLRAAGRHVLQHRTEIILHQNDREWILAGVSK